MRSCVDCGNEKPLDDFHRNANGHPLNHCKPCHTARTRAWRAANPDKVREYARRDRERHPERYRASRREYSRTPQSRVTRARWVAANRDSIKAKQRAYRRDVSRWREFERKYGLTREGYGALEASQGGACAICSRPLRDARVHVDHDHSTGVVRGLLCQRCNQAIGLLGDSAAVAANAAAYLGRV